LHPCASQAVRAERPEGTRSKEEDQAFTLDE